MFKQSDPRQARVAIIGLGYVGLPLAVEFGKQLDTTGFDISGSRVTELQLGSDHTREISPEELRAANHLHFTTLVEDLADCNIFIVTVPTPIDQYRRPDLGPLLAASKTIGVVLKQGDVVVYESTVYPGATEEDCVPVLEQVSGFKCNVDFFVGYSPERINPGDRQHRLPNIRKVTSGSTPEAADFIDRLYNLIIVAGTHRAPNIRVAEAAKVIENTQRDLNIALVNELALIFERMDIDTEDVLAAARTKWNFLDFRPGLVGGHCIGVDPYYLTHKAQALGIHPEVILSGRRINDRLGEHIADRVAMLMTTAGINPVGGRVLVLGLAFKENCPDIRNTRVVDLVRGLTRYNLQVDVLDPWVSPADALQEYGLHLIDHAVPGAYDAVILAVSHDEFRALGRDVRKLGREACVIFDVKHVLPRDIVTARL
jgi:UDP-N-acetyl-D-glucosamine/UDP-N-acetyl-D-galactosamine dehydrogenase